MCAAATNEKPPRTLVIHAPSCWPSNLKRSVRTLIASPGDELLQAEVRESPSLPAHVAVASFRSADPLQNTLPSPLAGNRDAYEWTSRDDQLLICGVNPRSAAFGVFEIARRLGLRWLTWMREPLYVLELAERIPERYRWQAAFPSTVSYLDAHGGYGAIVEVERQCCWLLFHHWNTYWYGAVDVSPNLGELVHSFGLRYEVGGHDLRTIVPRRYFAERPDFFPVVRGKRTADMGDFACQNPEVKEIVQREAMELFRRHRGAERIHLWYDDVWLGAEDESAPASWSPTRRAAEELRLISGIHRDAAPGQNLVTLAYNNPIIPDHDAPFDPNVGVLFCPRERCQIHPLDGCGRNREYLDLLHRWVDLLGPERIFYLDYSLDHYIRVSTWGANPSADVLWADMQMLAKLGLGSLHTFYFSDYSDVECALVTYALMHAAARPSECVPDRVRKEYFRLAFGPHADVARGLFDLYSPMQAAFLRYDDYRGRKRDMRFAGLDQTEPSLQHAKLLTEALKSHGPKLEEALHSVATPSIETAPGRELYRMIQNMRFSLRQFSLSAAMLEGVPYIRGESLAPSARKAWLTARDELARLKPEVGAFNADIVAAGTWSQGWLTGWSAQMDRCLQFGKVDERD